MEKTIGALSREQLLGLFETWELRHPLHSHPWLETLFHEGMNDLDDIKAFAEVLYVFCERFHDCGWAIGLNARPDRIANAEEVRKAIADNLFDEYGGYDPTKGHLCLMRKFLYSLGYTDQDILNIRLNPGANRFMMEILRVCLEEHPITAIGCVFIGAECNGSLYFRKIYEAFKKKPCLQNADLYVLEIHSHDDIEHRKRMLKLIDSFLDDPESRRLLHYGFTLSIHLFQELWTSMALYHPEPEPPKAAYLN